MSPAFGVFLNIPRVRSTSLWMPHSRPAAKFYGDSDGDGVMNGLDCEPYNSRKQGPQHSVVGRSESVVQKIKIPVNPAPTPRPPTPPTPTPTPKPTPQIPTSGPRIGMPNPATIYAKNYADKFGGTYVTRTDTQGNQSGGVISSTGRYYDEWSLYRKLRK